MKQLFSSLLLFLLISNTYAQQEGSELVKALTFGGEGIENAVELKGRVLKTWKGNHKRLEVNDISLGTYFLRRTESGLGSTKIMISK